MKTISLCMIVKDEEMHIEKCLTSVKDLVNEMIIVDTGSTDKTVEICEKLGATVYQYDWENNFSAARNFGLQLCQGNWILSLDADEHLDVTGTEKITPFLTETSAKVIAMPILNYYGSSANLVEKNYYLLYQPRLFQNHLGIKFENRVHETIKCPTNFVDGEITKLNVPIHHYGYTAELIENKNKAARNLLILREELNNPDHSPMIEYHIASEFYRAKNYEAAFQFVNQAILLFLKDEKYPPSILYKLKYDILIDTKNWQGAWPSIDKAIQLYPDYVDLHYYKGLILYQLEKYGPALEAFRKCLELGDNESDHLVLNGVGSFKAVEYEKRCLEHLKN